MGTLSEQVDSQCRQQAAPLFTTLGHARHRGRIITDNDELYFFDAHLVRGGTGGAVLPLLEAVTERIEELKGA